MPLKSDDLRDTILPRISVDEFEPKSGRDDEIVVVALFAADEQPAKDLDNFIETSIYDIIDADVSPNPDEEGRFLIFLELKRQADFWQKLDSIIEDIENITGKQKWMVSVRGLDYECFLGDDELKTALILDPIEYIEDKANGDELQSNSTDVSVGYDVEQEMPAVPALESFFSDSLLLTTDRNDSIIVLRDHHNTMKLELVDFGESGKLIERQELTGASLLENPYEVRKLRFMLGQGWHVNKVKDKLVVDNDWSDNLLITRYIE